MIHFLIVSNHMDSMNLFEQGLAQHCECRIDRANTGQEALSKVMDKALNYDLVIVDKEVSGTSGKRWLSKIITANPMVNTALVSDLSDEDFHEDTEGFGVLMKISPSPDQSEAGHVVERLTKVLSLYQNISS